MQFWFCIPILTLVALAPALINLQYLPALQQFLAIVALIVSAVIPTCGITLILNDVSNKKRISTGEDILEELIDYKVRRPRLAEVI